MLERSILLAAIVSLLACTGTGTSERCREACKRDSECHNEREEEDRSYRFDRDECEATCAILERDEEGRERVKAHAKCVKSAPSCAEVLTCP